MAAVSLSGGRLHRFAVIDDYIAESPASAVRQSWRRWPFGVIIVA